MIEILDIGIEDVVAYRIEGKVTEDEMKSVIAVFKEKIQGLIPGDLQGIGGAEFDAIIEKLKFFREFGFTNFDKIAVVTHKEWMHKIIDLEGKFFKKFDMKGFSIDDKDKALAFLKSGE